MTSDRPPVGSRWHTNREGRRSQGGQCVARQVRGVLGMVALVYSMTFTSNTNGTRGAVCARNWVGFRGMGACPVRIVCVLQPMCAAAGAGNGCSRSAPS